MESLRDYMDEYRKQLKKGAIQKAYRGLMEYFMGLRTHFEKKCPNWPVSGSVYHGYMDMTYFALFPESLKRRKLKIAIVFVYDTFRFEVWLSGCNRQVQSDCWKLFRESDCNGYRIVPSPEGVDSIVEHVCAENPDFNDVDGLTKRIEKETVRFIGDVEKFLAAKQRDPARG